MACLGEQLDIPHQHIHVCQDADTVLDDGEGLGLGCGGGCEDDGGGECEKC